MSEVKRKAQENYNSCLRVLCIVMVCVCCVCVVDCEIYV